MKTSRQIQGVSPWLPRLFTLLLVGLLVVLTACNGAMPTQTAGTLNPHHGVETTDMAPTTDLAEETGTDDASVSDESPIVIDPNVVAAHNALGMRVFAHLLAQDAGEHESVFVSPSSIALALSMAYNGADGATAQAMAQAMQLGGLSREAVNASSLALLRALDSAQVADPQALGIQLDIANSIWHRQEFALNDAFVQDNQRFYRAEVAGLDFNAPTSVDTINGWVSDATHGLIPTVVDSLDADLAMMLINAVYFKGDWTTPFDKHATRDMPFHLTSGDTRDVPMMYRSGQIGYYEESDMQAIRLPYGDDERLAMYVFLPRAGEDFSSFARNLTHEVLGRAFKRFTPQHGEVILPRMDIEYKSKLNDALQALGMGIAFNGGQADFSRMRAVDAGPNLYLGDVIHQSVLKVDEEGTEAAAVTSIDVRLTSLPMYDFRFRADRPFVLAIRDDVTGALLFVGAIMDPLG